MNRNTLDRWWLSREKHGDFFYFVYKNLNILDMNRIFLNLILKQQQQKRCKKRIEQKRTNENREKGLNRTDG